MSKFTDGRDAVLHFFANIFTSIRAALNTWLHVSLTDAEKIGEDNLPKAEQIIKDAVVAAEKAGGTWYQKRDAALAVILPQFIALGINLLSTTIDMLISNTVAALGYSSIAGS